jgi:hypothetical protein
VVDISTTLEKPTYILDFYVFRFLKKKPKNPRFLKPILPTLIVFRDPVNANPESRDWENGPGLQSLSWLLQKMTTVAVEA